MKTIITAIDNHQIYTELKNNKDIKIIGKDLIYKEAILEILEKNKNINVIILYEKILGEINFFELIKKIKNINKKIKLIIILENKNEKLEKNLKKINIKNIYLKNKINSKKIIEIINEKNKLNNINMKKNNNITKRKEKNEKLNFKNNIFKILNKIKNKKIKIINILDYIYKSIKGQKTLSKKPKESKHNKERQNKTIIILNNKKNKKSQVSLSIAEKSSNKNTRIAIINLTNNTTDKKKYKNNINKQKLIEKELKKYKKEKSKINLLKNLNEKDFKTKNFKIKNIKEKNENKKRKKIKNKINKNKTIKKYNLKINKKYNNDLKNKNIEKNKNEIINNLKNILLKKTENKLIYFLNLNLLLKNKNFIDLKNNKQKIEIIKGIIKKLQTKFEYIIIEIEEIKNKELREEIIKNSNKIIIFLDTNYLGIKRLYNFLNKNKNNANINKKSLHIVAKKMKIYNISHKIIKQIFNEYKVSYIKRDNKLKN